MIFKKLSVWLIEEGLDLSAANILSCCIIAAGVCACVGLLLCILFFVVNPLITRVRERTDNKIDDILLPDSFLKWCWWLIGALCLRQWLPMAFVPYPSAIVWIVTIMDVIAIGLGTKAVVEFVNGAFLVIFDHDKVAEEGAKICHALDEDEEYQYVPSHSLQGLKQMICFVIGAIGVILMVSVLFGKNPILIVSGLGAGAAVLMLVFKDSILGVVAGIQLTSNDMLRPGDWIIASKYGANGRVQEVTLATVKVLNWDHTIVTIPPYNLITDSFQNWRRMEESGGRRVQRSFNIDMTTVRFLTDDEKKQYADEPWASDFDMTGQVANLTVFRKYLESYVRSLPTLRPNMLFMVRELQPTPEGLPVELYFFTSRTGWAAYEQIQANALDHVIASVNRFGLRLFQSPTGADLRALGR